MNPAPDNHFEHGDVNLLEYFRVIRERKWYIIFAVLVILTLGGIFTYKTVPVYQSSCDIEISPYTPTVFKIDPLYNNAPLNTYEYGHFSKTKIAYLSSLATAAKVRERLVPLGLGEITPEELVGLIRAQQGPETYLWTLSVRGIESEQLPIILNAYVQVFIEGNVTRRHEVSRSALDTMEKERDRLEAEKARLDRDLIELKNGAFREYDIHLKPTAYDEASLELSQTNKELEKAEITGKKLDAVLNAFNDSKSSGIAIPSSIDELRWPTIENQKKQYLAAYTRYAALHKKYGASHPRRIKADLELKSIQESMHQTIEGEIELYAKKTELLTKEKSRRYQKIKDLQRIFPPFAAAHEKHLSVKNKLETLETDILTLKPNMHDTASNIHIVNPASMPTQIKPNIPVNMLLALVLGLLLGLGLAFLREYIDRSIKTVQHFEHLFQAPVLAVIPFIKKDAPIKEAVVYSEDESLHADMFRMLRTKLVYLNHEDPSRKVFVITSPNPDEGKTLTTTNLALSFQKTEKKILLIEGDLWKPKIKPVFAKLNGGEMQPDSPGLSDVLAGDTPLEDCVYHFENGKHNLHVLFRGRIEERLSEVIAPESFQGFMDKVRQEYDFIFIDSPPLNEKADGAVIATCADGVLMVVRRARTNWESAENAKRILDDVQAPVTGGILNITTTGKYYGPYGLYKGYYYQKQ